MTTVAAVQMCSTSDVEENLAAAAGLIASAARQGARLIVLPENFAVMGVDDDERCRQKEVFGAGKIQDFLSAQSQKHHVWIVGGTIPMACQDEAKVRAASLLFNEAGECVARYDKIHLFDVVISDHESYKESDGIQPGSKIVVAETPIGKIGMAVCYDIRFPELFRCMANAGAEILVLPSAFTVKTGEAHWEVLTRSRAIENFCYVIGAGQGGTHGNGRRTYGHSLIIHPWGRKLAELTGEGAGVICADLNPDELAEIRKSIPVAQHQRIFFNINGLNEK
ncbi:2-oxoglutaramate amidase [Aquicella siphonis]|uniref:2-oxoglutaramate amidase n=1 Tax=Aquicella siphonis TaxID=254247 RepID=A0A5E4PF08_9COXI|nr:carbon-nitrogen hydrolase family protein [Aquicella siphonis]VVC75078.1 2-oxoglutaramate amidase [Aquicella siphonis]